MYSVCWVWSFLYVHIHIQFYVCNACIFMFYYCSCSPACNTLVFFFLFPKILSSQIRLVLYISLGSYVPCESFPFIFKFSMAFYFKHISLVADILFFKSKLTLPSNWRNLSTFIYCGYSYILTSVILFHIF